ITGSCGKSTTKEALGRILSELGPTAKTEGNLNSEYGLPLSLFGLDDRTRYSVFELGIDHVGEMDVMLSMFKPSIALLTNIGISHLEKLGSRKVIAQQKSKIFHPGLQAGFISRSCAYLPMIQANAPVLLQSYAARDIAAVDLGLEGWRITYKGMEFTVGAVGRHLLEDLVGAIAIGEYLGACALDIAQALDGFEPLKGRSYVDASDITIIDDSYNASLDSMQSILTYLSSLSYVGKKKVVLGPMKELGNLSVQAHRKIARILACSSFSSVYLYGREMEVARQELLKLGFLGDVFYTDDFYELEQRLTRAVAKGDLFLLKASRCLAFERLIPPLKLQMQKKGIRYA
ncbi:MAG: UDP-N-acetylmuramoylalanyl-D-glutamate--2,6-diaminopimelate ligase, partial [Spirochaetia bacterium]|nr:UDP-N-acetylmuramoylalanyl-D-glutamate--2,6-diaminopimelate ligase [Spirochaetia bacterium]